MATGIIHSFDASRFMSATGNATTATVYFYYAGTNTLAPVFTDKNLTIPSVNPLTPAKGAILPRVYLTQGVAYRRKIVFADGTIYDSDPIPATAEYSAVELAVKEAEFYADEAQAAAAVVSVGQAVRAETVDGFTIIANPRADNSSSHASTAAFEWAKGFDAHATLDSDTQIKVGRVITAVSTTCKIPAAATKFRARVFSRASTENGLPEGGYDTLVVDTGAVPLADAGMVYDADYSGYGIYALPLPVSFTVEASKCYLLVWEFQDSTSARVAASVPYKTVASGAFRLGGYLDTGAGWANYSTSRLIPMGMGTGTAISLTDALETAIAAYDPLVSVAAPSLVRPIESLFLRPDPHVRWRYPGVTTAASGGEEGLSRVLGKAAWVPGLMMGEEGITFGCRIATGSLTDLTTDPEYSVGPPKRLLLTSSDVANSPRHAGSPYEFVFRGGKLEGAYIDVQLNAANVLLEDCLVDADGENIGSGIQQASALTDPGTVRMNHCTVRGFFNNNASLINAHLSNCSLDFTAADTLNGGSSKTTSKMWIDNCLLRRPGNSSHPFANPTAHSDVIGFGAANNMRLVGSTLYYTAGSSDYSEGVYGDTSGIGMGSIVGTSSNNWFIGNIIGGGSYNVYLGLSNAAARVNNWMFINNIFLADGYAAYDGFYCFTYVAGAQLKNLFLWDNIGADGAVVRMQGSRLPLAANVPAIAAGAQITITNGPNWQWTPGGGTALRGFFGYDAATLGDAELEAIIELQRNYGVTIIDPFTRELNPLYNLGNWVNS